MIIDFDTTWYGGWGAPVHKRPPFRSIKMGQNGEQDAMKDDENGDAGDEYQVYGGGQMDADHTNYHLHEPAVHHANVEMDAYYDDDDAYMDYREYDEDEGDVFMDYARYRPERVDRYVKYEIIGENDIGSSVLRETWLQKVFKHAIYAMVGSICLCAGVIIGYLFVGYYQSYKGRVVHISRF